MKHFQFIVLFTLLFTAAFSQPDAEKANLERERKQLKADLDNLQKQYNSVKGESKKSLLQLTLLNNKISLHEKYINSINTEIKSLDNNIYRSNIEIYRLRGQLDTLKKQYAGTVVYTYKNRSSYDFVNFIFSSTSVNDALKRITYLKSYRTYRTQQMKTINETGQLITMRQKQQIERKSQKGVALQDQSLQKSELEVQQQDKTKVVQVLKSQEKEIQTQITSKKKRDNQVRNKISSIIKEEIAEAKRREVARRAAEKKAADEKRKADAKTKADEERAREIARKKEAEKNNEAKSENPVITIKPPPIEIKNEPAKLPQSEKKEEKKPESYLEVNAKDIALGNSFESNKHKLPWPVDNCYISVDFGKSSIEGTKIQNNNTGITLATPSAGMPVKAVFDGEVYTVLSIEGYYAVILRHGKYITSYYGLSAASVAKGQTIKTGQVVGKTSVSEEGSGGTFDFMLLIEDREVDPKPWLRPR